MAQVIPFPFERMRLDWPNASPRQRYLWALQFVLDSIRSGEVDPTEVLIMYGTRSGGETIWSYLNLGFDPKLLTVAMCRVLDDVEERDDESRAGGSSRGENGCDPDIPA